jgi:hypothetical protein
MRIALDRKRLLGFEDCGRDLPTHAAKVGVKTVIVGVPSASHDELASALVTPRPMALVFPVKQD